MYVRVLIFNHTKVNTSRINFEVELLNKCHVFICFEENLKIVHLFMFYRDTILHCIIIFELLCNILLYTVGVINASELM